MTAKHCNWCNKDVEYEGITFECYYCKDFICDECITKTSSSRVQCPICCTKHIRIASHDIIGSEYELFSKFLLKSFNVVDLYMYHRFEKIRKIIGERISGIESSTHEQFLWTHKYENQNMDVVSFFNDRGPCPATFNRKSEKCELFHGMEIPFGVQYKNREEISDFLWKKWFPLVGSPETVIIDIHEIHAGPNSLGFETNKDKIILQHYEVTLYELLTNTTHFINFLKTWS
jgi:hypothetical protein